MFCLRDRLATTILLGGVCYDMAGCHVLIPRVALAARWRTVLGAISRG